jgi:SAM-dependent methyltransferase
MTTVDPVLAELSTQPRPRSFSEVYSDALRGESCTVRGIHADDDPLPVDDWLRPVNHADRALLEHCRGATLDVGCGPGRMSAHLAERGHVVMGVDIVREAVDQATSRGVHALRRNVFDPLPGEGGWNTVLLADGNIGIGGAPVRLLRRAGDLLDRTGRVVCDLAAPGTGLRQHDARLVTHRKSSGSFPWAQVGPEAIERVAADAGLRLVHLGDHHGRWFAVLAR